VVLFTFFESVLCLGTLGTIIPTIYLGKKLNPHYLPFYFIFSGLIVGILFSFSNSLNQIGFKDPWGIHTWAIAGLNFMILVYVIQLPALSLKSALEINFVLQILLISCLPISNQLFIENTLLSQMFTYTVLTGGIIIVFYNSYLFMLSSFANKDPINLSLYLYVVLLVLIGFRPVSETSGYVTFIMNFAIQYGIWPLGISLSIHFLLLPLFSLIPFGIMKSLITAKG